jgi:hypothetical protein
MVMVTGSFYPALTQPCMQIILENAQLLHKSLLDFPEGCQAQQNLPTKKENNVE